MSEEEILEDLLKRFDFEEVSRVMIFLDWTWIQNDGSYLVPTIEDMKVVASDLFHSCYKSAHEKGKIFTDCSTGGFEVSYLPYNDKFKLSFILEYNENL